MEDQALQDYFAFDAADLTANRAGQLTDKQKKYFAEDVKDTFLAGLIVGAAIFLIPTVIALVLGAKILLNGQQTHAAAALGALTPLIAVVLIFAVLGGVVVLWSFLQSRSTASFSLKQTSGPVNIVAVERRDDAHHPAYKVNVLHIGPLAMDIKSALAGSLMQGDVYTAYYYESQDGSRQQVLSLERAPAR